MWEEELNVAESGAREAGRVMMKALGRKHHIMKKGEIDLVTEADLEAEQVILEAVHRAYPSDNILSEERGKDKQGSSRTWLVDPLDGTTNFAHGFPFFAASVALELEGRVVLGVVHNPFLNETFTASEGQGAFLDGTPMRTSRTASLNESLLATGFPYDVHERHKEVLRLFEAMLVRAQGVRRPGAATLDLCYVASGRFDGFWEEGLKPWDTAAGAVIVQEAGGRVSRFSGKPYSPYESTILAANPAIYEDMRRILSGG